MITIEAHILGKIPPHSLEAEQSVLGAMLINQEAINTAIEQLAPEDFYKEANKEIFKAMIELYKRNEPVDIITLSEELKRKDILENIGGVTYLTSLSGGVAISSNIKYYCDIVEEKALLRQLIASCDEIMAKSYEASEEVNSIIEQAEKKIFDITQGRHKGGFAPIKDVLLESFSKIEEMAAREGELTGLTTGFIDIDSKLSGMQKSDLILLAARPSMGKTALGINIATNAAIKANASVAIFSLEMSKEQLAQRMISSISHVNLQNIISGRLKEEEWLKIINGIAPLSQSNIFIDDTAGISLMEIKAKCRKLKIEKGLDLIVIDYLQLMQSEMKHENRQQEISAISRGLKALAKEMDCPVLALSQLSRAPELRSDHRPILSDLRESGAIEQDADVVLFLYRDEYYNEDTDKKNIGEVIIAKHRNGPTGTVELVWKQEFTKFLNKENIREEL
ncbi:primary replicative DNA helicase [Keratinibaculum paraultunense]|uniref:Replicative DNA helicase n=2 Tax=Keratinibaculum paraultunense TaxID=1278232 RepID=A0A4R3KUB0_9FIRM|nr:primary replicative DNA helicase [Keratinibaculum paraultunense]